MRNQTVARSLLIAAYFVVLGVLGACASNAQKPAPLSDAQIQAIVASVDRSAADRVNDVRRHPAQMLAFIGIRPGSVALDVSAGGGYTTELLARAIGPTGHVFGQSPPREPPRAGATRAAPEGDSAPTAAAASAVAPLAAAAASMPSPAAPRPPGSAVVDRDAKLRAAGIPAAPMVSVVQRFENPAPSALAVNQLDLVTLMFNYHDLGHLGVDRAAMNRAIFQALRPGGVFVVADHAGRPGTGISEAGTLHRIEEAFLRGEVEAAGFKFADEGMFLRNPNDPRDQNTPNPPQPKDEFVLKFVKP